MGCNAAIYGWHTYNFERLETCVLPRLLHRTAFDAVCIIPLGTVKQKRLKGELLKDTTNWTAKNCHLSQPCFHLSPKPSSTHCSQTVTRKERAVGRGCQYSSKRRSQRRMCQLQFCHPRIPRLSLFIQVAAPFGLWGSPPSNPGCLCLAWTTILFSPRLRQTSLSVKCPTGFSLFPLGFSETSVCSSQLSREVSSPPFTSRSHHIFFWPPLAAFLSCDLPVPFPCPAEILLIPQGRNLSFKSAGSRRS